MYLCYMLLLQWLLVVAYPVGHLIAKIGDDHFPSEFALIGPPIALLLAKRRHQVRTNLSCCSSGMVWQKPHRHRRPTERSVIAGR